MIRSDQENISTFWSWFIKYKWIILIVVLILLILGILAYFYFKPTTTSFVNNTSQLIAVKINSQLEITLAIGSSFLEIEDTTSLSKRFQLNGNAIFKIQPSEAPVIVIGNYGAVTSKGGDIMIKQVEKSFEAWVTDGDAVISKSLNRSFNEGLNLSKSEVGQVAENIEGIMKRVNRNPNYGSWYTKKITFEGTLLSDALKLLEEVYGQRVNLPSIEAGKCRVVGTFENASFEDVLYQITKNINLTVSKNDIEYNLEGIGCL